MATITELLGTDSISSSRPVINSNFQLLNDALADIQALVDPSDSTIQNISSATVERLIVFNNTSNIAIFETSGIALNTDVEVNARMTLGGEIIKTGIEGSAVNPTAVNSPSSLSESTYFINTDFKIPAGILGQEVTFINVDADPVTITTVAGIDLGATSISLIGLNSTITLRFIGNIWYVIASHSADIS